VLAGALLPAEPMAADVRPLHAASHTVWLCRPGAASDPCASDRTATSVGVNFAKAAFSTAVTPRAKSFDCFYVYPTVSGEPSLNSDLAIQKEEINVAIAKSRNSPPSATSGRRCTDKRRRSRSATAKP
jgi:hypothetical protein